MPKTLELLKVSSDVSDAIKAGRHPLTDDWNSPGYLNRDEWDRMGSELERVVVARVEVQTVVERVRLREEIDAATGMQEKAKAEILANAKELADMKSLLIGEQAKVAKLTEDLAVERTTLQSVRSELANIQTGPTGA